MNAAATPASPPKPFPGLRTLIKPQYRLEQWEVVPAFGGGYMLRGQVFGRNDFAEGELVRTSLVMRLDFVEMVAETLNTIYLLGQPLEPFTHRMH